MDISLNKGTINGSIKAPPSKSSMQRACAAALLHRGNTVIHNPGKSEDDLIALKIIQQLGALVHTDEEGKILIKGNPTVQIDLKEEETLPLFCGESGLSLRMFTPIAAISKTKINIQGTGSLLNRPTSLFKDFLPGLGVEIEFQNDQLPLTIQGPLQPQNTTIDGSISSQFITGIIFALSRTTTSPITITVNNLVSTPYIDLTLDVLKKFGYKISHINHEVFTIDPVSVNEDTIHYTVEGDWSGASFLLVAGAIAGTITLTGLDVFSTQADKAILQAIMMSGAHLSITEEKILVEAPKGNKKLQPFQFNANNCPDLFPPLVVLAACCEGTSIIEGANRLINKESNRAKTLQDVFGKLGVIIELQDDYMIIHGGKGIEGGIVHSNNDHRIAMAFAVASLQAKNIITIENAEVINKSYPDFYKDLSAVTNNI